MDSWYKFYTEKSCSSHLTNVELLGGGYKLGVNSI